MSPFLFTLHTSQEGSRRCEPQLPIELSGELSIKISTSKTFQNPPFRLLYMCLTYLRTYLKQSIVLAFCGGVVSFCLMFFRLLYLRKLAAAWATLKEKESCGKMKCSRFTNNSESPSPRSFAKNEPPARDRVKAPGKAQKLQTLNARRR